jgi:hypothetical protein
MSPIADLESLIEDLSEESLRKLVDFARSLAIEDEQAAWDRFGQASLARAYGPDEPEYNLSDLQPRPRA